MLVLSRKTSEQIVVGNDIVLTITQISGSRVTIGIEAPGSVAILRGELLKKPDYALLPTDAVASSMGQVQLLSE